MYGRIIRKGKSPDVYFSNSMIEDKQTQKRLEEMALKDEEIYLAKAKSRKKGAKTAEEYKIPFKPTGPQEYKDLYVFLK